ncbi:uncharacterized protein LOC123431342 [Hordeum vulgare subsp. vulgare]|uniref:uncharacterized protein LOC123431342 n=1 Tax=Hordeum vulgare subsp. vulgare TaxID=112509 RepID=UPI001D1A4045|nr:uncharacterized protein LOC123431342 [Hordeum vulgare subsp. vulgare]
MLCTLHLPTLSGWMEGFHQLVESMETRQDMATMDWRDDWIDALSLISEDEHRFTFSSTHDICIFLEICFPLDTTKVQRPTGNPYTAKARDWTIMPDLGTICPTTLAAEQPIA